MDLYKKKEAIANMANKALTIIEDQNNPKFEKIKDDYLNNNTKTVNRIHSDTEIMILNQDSNKE